MIDPAGSQPAGGVYLTAAQARLAFYAVRDVIARRAIGNRAVPVGLGALHTYLASSVDGTKAFMRQPQSGPSTAEDLIDTKEASVILGCSPSWVRRRHLRQQLGGRSVGGRHVFPRQTVLDYANRRKAGQPK